MGGKEGVAALVGEQGFGGGGEGEVAEAADVREYRLPSGVFGEGVAEEGGTGFDAGDVRIRVGGGEARCL